MQRIITRQKWNPDLSSSGQNHNPEWTKILLNNVCIMNSIENTEWENPVQIEICEFCGISKCNSNGNVWISKIKDLVMFSEPSIDEIFYIIGSSIIENNRVYLTKDEWTVNIESFNNTIKFSKLPNSQYWNLFSYMLINSPLNGLQYIKDIDKTIIEQIIYVEGFIQEKFIAFTQVLKQKDLYNKDIDPNEIIDLTKEYIPVNIYFDDGNEWGNFYSKNDQLFYHLGNNYLWEFHLTTAST